MKKILKKIGSYCLLDLVAVGGMADVFRARAVSRDGDVRLLAIKKIQPGFLENPAFLRMFRSELQVALRLNHPNIVRLYDFGHHDGLPYLVMELIHGMTLRQILSGLQEKSDNLSIQASIYTVEQVANGLNYAHTFRDPITNQSDTIIHRDISPQNIMLSYDGAVKIIDFGIAKASTNIDRTRTGMIKGKPSYLSPEQIAGEKLDGRADVFALGAVLWELLTGLKAFSGANDLEIMEKVLAHHPPKASSINRNVPVALDQICELALSKVPEHRFSSAAEMGRALNRFLNSEYPEFVPSDLSRELYCQFREEIERDLTELRALNQEFEEKGTTGIFHDGKTGTLTDQSLSGLVEVPVDDPKTLPKTRPQDSPRTAPAPPNLRRELEVPENLPVLELDNAPREARQKVAHVPPAQARIPQTVVRERKNSDRLYRISLTVLILAFLVILGLWKAGISLSFSMR